jgi:hypothetical protein
VVFKPFLQTLHGWRETRRPTREHLGRIETVRLAPALFQALVPGVAGPRVTGLPISAALVVRLHAGRRTRSHADVQPLRRAG